jgi:hypothetical protein
MIFIARILLLQLSSEFISSERMKPVTWKATTEMGGKYKAGS